MSTNLEQRRGQPSVWDPPQAATDRERWIAGALAGALFFSGFRRRTASGLALVLAGATAAWWAAAAVSERQTRRGRLRAVLPMRQPSLADVVAEASEESFPASDAPSWTPTTGNTGPLQS